MHVIRRAPISNIFLTIEKDGLHNSFPWSFINANQKTFYELFLDLPMIKYNAFRANQALYSFIR